MKSCSTFLSALVVAALGAPACAPSAADGTQTATAQQTNADTDGFLQAGAYVIAPAPGDIESVTFDPDQAWPDGNIGWGTYHRKDTTGLAFEGDFNVQVDNVRGSWTVVFHEGHDSGSRSLDEYELERNGPDLALRKAIVRDGNVVDLAPIFTLTPSDGQTAPDGRVRAGAYRLSGKGIANVTFTDDSGKATGLVSFGKFTRTDLDGQSYSGDFTYQHDNIHGSYQLVFDVGEGSSTRLLDLYEVTKDGPRLRLAQLALLDGSLAPTGTAFTLAP